MFRYST